ncbi:MAG TPA: hypothetical protein VGF86_01345 [Candidatus Tumulicola sp.]|jgi:hypothetical protein
MRVDFAPLYILPLAWLIIFVLTVTALRNVGSRNIEFRSTLILVGGFAAGVSSTGMVLAVKEQMMFSAFTSHAISVAGTVIQERGNTVYYAYPVPWVSGASERHHTRYYAGRSSLAFVKGDPKVGEALLVYYNASSPATSRAGDILAAHRARLLELVGFWGLLIPAVLVALTALSLRQQQRR